MGYCMDNYNNAMMISTKFYKKQLCALIQSIALGLVVMAPVGMTAHAHAATVTDFSKLVEQVADGVVRVSITKKVTDTELAEYALQQYFGGRVPAMPTVEHFYGTGFFISKDGYILTNHHVVADADTITITMNDRTELDAKLIGTDEASDVAVLKVEGNNFPALPVAMQDELKVGEPVLAIGSPFGFDYSASAGIVSAKSRNFSKEAAVPFIQSDVALNPGNSGGPLFNQKGEVVGVNSRIFSETGGYMGLSFSIPIDAAMDIYEQIRTTGKVVRVYLGIGVQDIDRNLAEAYGLDKPKGALLTSITPDATADELGLMRGDLILSFNGVSIHHASDLLNLINRAKPNEPFVLTYRRDGKDVTVSGKFSGNTGNRLAQKQQTLRLGISLKELSSKQAHSLGIKGGVVITLVDAYGLAARSGLQAGDIVLRFHQQDIASAADFDKAVKSLPKEGVVTVHLLRQGMPAIIGLRIESN